MGQRSRLEEREIIIIHIRDITFTHSPLLSSPLPPFLDGFGASHLIAVQFSKLKSSKSERRGRRGSNLAALNWRASRTTRRQKRARPHCGHSWGSTRKMNSRRTGTLSLACVFKSPSTHWRLHLVFAELRVVLIRNPKFTSNCSLPRGNIEVSEK